MQHYIGLTVIGFGAGVFATIASSIWANTNSVIQVMLIGVIFAALFIAINLLRNIHHDQERYEIR